MRLQISIPQDAGDKIRAIAEAEHRPVRYQVERLVIEALEKREVTAPDSDSAHTKEAAHVQ